MYFNLIRVFLHTVLGFYYKMTHCHEFYAFPVISKPRYLELFSISLSGFQLPIFVVLFTYRQWRNRRVKTLESDKLTEVPTRAMRYVE